VSEASISALVLDGTLSSAQASQSRHAFVKERPILSAGELLVGGLLLAVGPFDFFFSPFRLRRVPLFGGPFFDLRCRGRFGGSRRGCRCRFWRGRRCRCLPEGNRSGNEPCENDRR